MIFKSKNTINTKRLARVLKEGGEDPFTIKEGKFRFGQMKDSAYYSDWTEHAFLSGTEGKEVVGRTFNSGRLRYFALVAIFALLLLMTRSAWLQIVKNEHYQFLAEGNRLRSETIEPHRGIIYDRNWQPLVKNKANFVLYLLPINLPKDELIRDNLIRRISRVLDGEATTLSSQDEAPQESSGLITDSGTFYRIKEILSEIRIGSLESYQPLFVADNIDHNEAMLLAMELPDWPGVFLSNKIRREYPYSNLGHILGYTGKINDRELDKFGKDYSLIDYVGKIGLEYSWEKELKGSSGKKNIEVDALGRQKKIINEISAQDGYNLLLSLDLKLQQKAEETANIYLEKYGLKRAAIIILDPNNGEVLALVSIPNYDNNAFAQGISQEEYNVFLEDPDKPLFNRAISGEFPSGSTIKMIFAAAALQEGIIDEKTSFVSTGGLSIGQWFFPDWKSGGHGVTSVRKAIAQSVNTFFYSIGGGYGDFEGLGLDRLVKYARLFGLGEKTGIDLHGESAGFIPTEKWKRETKNEPWYIGDTYHFAIGQGDVLVTPLQVANYTAAIANGGNIYVPHLVKEILGEDNKAVRRISKALVRGNFISSRNLEIVREGMRQTVTIGSAKYLNLLPVEVAGKTGTAQWSSQKAPHAWFTGFAPYRDPEIAITVLVEEGNEGSQTAVPIAFDILNWYFSNK